MTRFKKPPVDQEVSGELAHHLEMRVREFVGQGMTEADARAEALRRFGDVAAIAATMKNLGEQRNAVERRTEYLAELGQDLRYALRQLRSSPGFAAAAILTLALGIGASTSIFSIANAVLLRPFPFRDPSRLVRVFEANPTTPRFTATAPNFIDWRAQNQSFTDLAAYAGRSVSLTGDGDPERLTAYAATPSFFIVLGMAPIAGRGFTEDEGRPGGGAGIAMISRRLWQRRFAGDAAIVGRMISLDGAPFRVIGVASDALDFFNRADAWLPLRPDPASSRGDRRLSVIGRLKPGVTLERAQGDMDAIARRLAEQFPVDDKDWTTNVASFDDWIVGPALRTRVLVLLGAVGLLLLMACVNVASLLLARAGARQREMGLRAALGAGRGRIVRQLLTESLALASLGAVLGVAFAVAVVPTLKRVGEQSIPRFDEMTIDWRVLVFGVVASLVTGLLFGAVPSKQLSRFDLDAVLRGGGRITGTGTVRSALIVGSVGLAMLLLVGAGLMRGSFVKLMGVDPGFRAEGVLAGQISLPQSRYPMDTAIGQAVAQLSERLAAIPGVTGVGVTNIAPFSGGNSVIPFIPQGAGAAPGEAYRQAAWRTVTPGYFTTLGIGLRRGRLIESRDVRGVPNAVVISEAMAKLGWPGADPVGKQFRVAGSRDPWNVVGVVADLKDQTLDQEPQPLMYLAHAQVSLNQVWLLVRTSGDPMAMLPAVQREVWAMDKLLPVARAQPLAKLASDSAAEARLTMMIFALFGAAALALAVVGVYGLIAYSVTQRTREIGVRLALGARPGQIVGLIMRRGVGLAVLGVGIGLLVARALAGYVRTILYGVTPTDLGTYAGVAGLLILCAVIASVLPARRAARLQPTLAIRTE